MVTPPNANEPAGQDPQVPDGQNPRQTGSQGPQSNRSLGSNTPPESHLPQYPPQGPAPPPAGGYPGWPPPVSASPRRNTGLIVGAVIAVAVLLLGALSLVVIGALRNAESESGAGDEHPSFETPTEPTGPTEPDTTEPETTAPPEDNSGPTTFGNAFTYEDGLSITVDPPSEFRPSSTASFEPAETFVRFTITLTNGSDYSFDTSFIYAYVQSGQHEAAEVFDSEQSLTGPPYTSLLPDRTVSWDVGFGVDDPDDVVFQISPSLQHEAAVFVSGLQPLSGRRP